jgi:hypothetical protein
MRVFRLLRPRWRWLRSLWCWWLLLVVAFLVSSAPHSAQRASAPVAAQHYFSPLVALAPLAAPASAAARADDCGVTDLTSCINDWINTFVQDNVADWFQKQVDYFNQQQQDNAEGYGFVFQTPDSLTYHAQPVEEMYHYALAAFAALLLVLLAIAGLNLMLGRSTSWSETLPPLIYCTLMAFAFQPFIAMFIQLSNDFIFGMQFAVGVAPTFPAYGAGSDVFMDLIALIFELIGDLLLALEALARLALLDLLIALAPLGIMCYALPQTRGWGRMWAEAFTATILIQPIQATLVMLGAKFLSLLAAFIQGPLPPVVQVLVGLASIIMALYVPRMLLSRATHVVADFHQETAQIGRVIAAAAA